MWATCLCTGALLCGITAYVQEHFYVGYRSICRRMLNIIQQHIQPSFRPVISKTLNLIAERTRHKTLFHYFLLHVSCEIFFATINST